MIRLSCPRCGNVDNVELRLVPYDPTKPPRLAWSKPKPYHCTVCVHDFDGSS